MTLRTLRTLSVTLIILAALLALGFLIYPNVLDLKRDANVPSPNRMPVAVLGDSDSHNYQDSYDNKSRGGEYWQVTFNWPTIWDLLRPNEVDLGRYDVWGTHYRIARVRFPLGLRARAPKKLDFEYNYAMSGLRCRSLLNGWPYQAKWLIDRIQRDAEYWRNGLVIIRIGVNDFGNKAELMTWADSALSEIPRDVVNRCVNDIEMVVESILDINTGIKVAVVGVARNYNLISLYPNVSELEIQNMESVLSFFDDQLRRWSMHRSRVAFVDDNRWFRSRLGSRLTGNLKTEFSLSNSFKVVNALGNSPENLVLADRHASTIYNGLWLQDMVIQLNAQLGLELNPPTEEEILKLLEQH